jgi:hypothetical protein
MCVVWALASFSTSKHTSACRLTLGYCPAHRPRRCCCLQGCGQQPAAECADDVPLHVLTIIKCPHLTRLPHCNVAACRDAANNVLLLVLTICLFMWRLSLKCPHPPARLPRRCCCCCCCLQGCCQQPAAARADDVPLHVPPRISGAAHHWRAGALAVISAAGAGPHAAAATEPGAAVHDSV